MEHEDIALRSLEESVAGNGGGGGGGGGTGGSGELGLGGGDNLVERFEGTHKQVQKSTRVMSLLAQPLVRSAGVSALAVLGLALYFKPPLLTKDNGKEQEPKLDIKQLAMWVGGGALAAVIISKVWTT